MNPRLTLYGHGYCSLCDAMDEALAALAGELAFVVDKVDIHDDATLEARYGADVPVLCHDGVEICRHRLDEAALRVRLATHS